MAGGRRKARAGRASRDRRAPSILLALSVAGLALLPSVGTLDAGWIAEDAAILGRAHRAGVFEPGGLGDWLGPQYGLHLLAFWRPLVTSAWWIQEGATGIDPVALRSLNVFLHVAAALLVAQLVKALGGRPLAVFLAGAWVALFPDQGGTVTWIAGRTDLFCGVLVAATLLQVTARRPVASALLAFLACSAKEFAFLLPLWTAVLLWGQGRGRGGFLRGFVPVLVACLLAFLVRRLALGVWVGGYLAGSYEPERLLEGARALGRLTLPTAGVALLMGGFGWLAGTLHGRLWVAGLVAGGSALLLLLPLAAGGGLGETNQRLLYLSDVGFALVFAAAVFRPSGLDRRRALGLATALVFGLTLAGWRGGLALADTREWREAARIAGERVAAARSSVSPLQPSELPVLFPGFPTSWRGAYCLGFGCADRFRAPFPETPRPVWPLRPLLTGGGERAPARRPRPDGAVLPRDEREEGVAPLAVSDLEGAPLEGLPVDERALLAAVDGSPGLRLVGGRPEGTLEVVLYTEAGYGVVPWPTVESEPRLSLMRLFALGNGAYTAGQLLLQAADLGATNAYLEIRVRGAGGECRAASPWIELAWTAEFVGALPPEVWGVQG